MKARLAMAAIGVLMVSAPPSVAGTGGELANPLAVYEVRAEAGGVHTSVAVPAYFEVFHPYSLSEASNGSSHSYQTPGYPGFFLRAAGEQYGMPPPPGTSETLWPQGPTEGGAEAVPFDGAAMGETSAESSETGAKGHATSGGGGLAGGSLGYGRTETAVRADGVPSAEARVLMKDLDLGEGLTIGEVRGLAKAVASGTPGGAAASGTVELVDVRFNGVQVTVTAEGIRAGGGDVPLPGSEGADGALALAGIELRRLPDVTKVSEDGSSSSIDVGGFEIRFNRPEREFTHTWTVGRLSASARAIPAGEPAPLEIDAGPVDVSGEAAPAVSTDPVAASRPASGQRGALISAEPARATAEHLPPASASWALLSLFFALGVPIALVFRRGLLAASTP